MNIQTLEPVEAQSLVEEVKISLPVYASIMVAADASDHSNMAVTEAVKIGSLFSSTITGAHVYAAKMHDMRFRQMEGGLPEQYREEDELEKQRDIHDNLITKGLGVITDSYLDQVELSCKESSLKYIRCSLEGKNYTEIVKEANSEKYDLLVMGSKGLGAIPGGQIGTVCDRVSRRCNIDTLVIKQVDRDLRSGPILVALDGSPKSYGGLLSAFSIAKNWGNKIHVISAYDPYYHYVAFNRIANVLSDEAGKVFRFKEQEKLHEDIIDAGLAKIYKGHLEVAESIAKDYNITITTSLLDGKPHDAIEKYASELNPSMLVIGRLGIHADDGLDIGGNASNLLSSIDCAVLLSNREFTPRIDVIAEATTQWTHQAEKRLENVPSFARAMARMGILRLAQSRGHTVITENIVDEAVAKLCPAKHHVEKNTSATLNSLENDGNSYSNNKEKFNPDWSDEAKELANTISDKALKTNAMMRAEKKARQDGSMLVSKNHLTEFVKSENTHKSGCPLGFKAEDNAKHICTWSKLAIKKLEKVPQGFMRKLTKSRVEVYANKLGATVITPEIMDAKYNDWGDGSKKQSQTMDWDKKTSKKLQHIPDFIRGMVILETERCAKALGLDRVTADVMKKASNNWSSSNSFHSNVTNKYK